MKRKTFDSMTVTLPPEMLEDIVADDLPETLQDMLAMIGLPATLKLVEAFPGVRIFVPATMHRDHSLAELLGFEAACKLAEYFQGSEYAVPRAADAIRKSRDRKIRRLYGPMTAGQLALKYGMTERQVYRIVAEPDFNENQIGLDF